MYRKAIKNANKAILIIMSFVLLFGALPQVALSQTPFPQHPRPVDYGDINRDGVINAADVTMLRRYIAATDKLAFIEDNPNFSEYNADIIGNGFIDAYTVEALREYLSATDISMMQLGPSGHVHTLEISSGLHFSDAVDKNGDFWYAITPQQTSSYEIVLYPYDMNVYPQVFDSGVWPVMPEDGAFTLYAGETYFICLEFEDIVSTQEYEITIIPRISLVSEHWDYYGNLFDDSPSNWITVTPEVSGEYNICFYSDNASVSSKTWELNNGLIPLSINSDGNAILQRGAVYFIEVNTPVSDFYSFSYNITLQLLDNFEEMLLASEDPYYGAPEGFDFSFDNNVPFEESTHEEIQIFTTCPCGDGSDGLITPFNANFYQYGRWVVLHSNDGNNRQGGHACTALHTVDQLANWHHPQASLFGANFRIIAYKAIATNGSEIIYYRYNANGTINNTFYDFTRSANWYAIWSSTIIPNPNTRTVTYSSHLATGGTAPPVQHFQSGTPVTILGRGTLERTGFNFAGWSIGSTIYNPGVRPTFFSNVTLTPVWTAQTLTVRYDRNGGTGSIPNSQNYTSGSRFRLASRPNDLQRPNFVFNGWNTQPNGTGRQFSGGGTAVLNGETVLYAQWRPVTYTIRYRANGAWGAAPKNQSVQHSTMQAIQGPNRLNKSGQVFVGWNTRADGYGTPYLPGAIAPNDDLTLYAIFVLRTEPNIVTYNTNGATGTVNLQTYTPNAWFNLRTSQGLTRTGHSFDGWYTQLTGTRNVLRFNSGQAVRFMGGAVPLYARWTPIQYTLTFDGNASGVTGVPAPITRNAQTTINIPRSEGIASIRLTGREFLGWNTRVNGGGDWYGHDLGHRSTISLTSDTTLYAIWTPPRRDRDIASALLYARTMGATVEYYHGASNQLLHRIVFNGISQGYDFGHPQSRDFNDKMDVSELNARFGWSNSWIPNGQSHAAYIGLHGAFMQQNPADHASIIVFAAPGTVFHGHAEFIRSNTNIRYVTFGGEAEKFGLFTQNWGHVVSLNNRDSDVDLTIKTAMIPLNVTVADIHSLLENAQYFRYNQAISNLTYKPTTIPANSYNSNSFARGLLNSVGISYSNPSLAPGWENPIPVRYFRR